MVVVIRSANEDGVLVQSDGIAKVIVVVAVSGD